MRSLIRIPQSLWVLIHEDLGRAHPIAAERVGFLFGRSEEVRSGTWLTCATGYDPVDDRRYVENDHFGATIDAEAIRTALQHVLESGDSGFHIHRHDHLGDPWFSEVDLDTIRRLGESFLAVAPNIPHGGLVLSFDAASSQTYVIAGEPTTGGEVSVVGPTMLVRVGRHAR